MGEEGEEVDEEGAVHIRRAQEVSDDREELGILPQALEQMIELVGNDLCEVLWVQACKYVSKLHWGDQEREDEIMSGEDEIME